MLGVKKACKPIGGCFGFGFARLFRRGARANGVLSPSGIEQSIENASSSTNTEKIQQVDISKIMKAESLQEMEVKKDL